jgi:hypothetical protein
MIYADLSKYTYEPMRSRARLLNIGWLDSSVPFRTGELPAGCLERLGLAVSLTSHAMRGIHGCPFCEGATIRACIGGAEVLLGMSEAWLPSTSAEVIYIAPSLVYHYVGTHRYLPPDTMVADVMALPLDPAQWDTPRGAYRQLRRRYA